MQIVKEFTICEVRATQASNAPFQIILLGNMIKREEKSSLVLDRDMCVRYNIPMSLDLVGRTLICLFESRELPLKNDRVDMGLIGNDELQIQSLKRNEVESAIFYTVPPSKYNDVSQILELSSFGGGDGVHLHIMPCPFYHFIVNLTNGDYRMCKNLPANSVFKVTFNLA